MDGLASRHVHERKHDLYSIEIWWELGTGKWYRKVVKAMPHIDIASYSILSHINVMNT